MLRLITKLLAFAGVASAYVVTGATETGRQPRKDVRDIYANKDEWNVYIQALIHFQEASQSDYKGYYGVAAIHGYPGGSWDSSKGVTGNPINCPHSSPHFPMWHRAYLMLYEQRLQAHAVYIAGKYPSSTRSKFVTIAKNLRSPYWDWALEQDGTAFPKIFTDDTLTIDTYSGRKVVSNPLKRYEFHPNAHGIGWQPFASAKYTNRCPSDPNNMNSPSNQGQSRANIDGSAGWFRDRIYKLLTKYDQWYQVSDSAWLPRNPNVNTQDSFESVHDNVHGAVGGNNGNMQQVPVSTYDPLFWLHHTNIDRLFAIWQALHPNSFFKSRSEKGSTYWFAQGSTSTATQSLVPFRKNSAGQYWNANDLRDWTKHGYNYKDTPAGYTAASVRKTVDQKYGSSASSTVSKRSVPQARSLRSRFFGSKVQKRDDDDSEAIEYLVNLYADKNALGKPYTVYAFLGEPTEKPENYMSSANLGGYQIYLPPPSNTTMPSIMVTSQIILNRAINAKIASGEIHDTDGQCIENYLQKNLCWKVVDGAGNLLEPSSVPKLALSVAVTKYGVEAHSGSDQGFIASSVGSLLGGVLNTTTAFKSDLLKTVYQGKSGALTNSSMYSWGVGSISNVKS